MTARNFLFTVRVGFGFISGKRGFRGRRGTALSHTMSRMVKDRVGWKDVLHGSRGGRDGGARTHNLPLIWRYGV